MPSIGPLKDPEFRLLERLVVALERVAAAIENNSRVAKVDVGPFTPAVADVDGQLYQATDNKVG